MQTDDLIDMLARNAPPVKPGILRRRYALALGWGIAGAVALMVALLGVRPDLASATRLPMFWVKLALPLALLLVALIAVSRLSRPGAGLGHAGAVIAIPVAGMWALAVVVLATASPAERGSLLFGNSWAVCPLNIALLSGPVFVGTFWAMGGLAPTRLALAGAFSGLLAGSAGALVYCLHCPEMAPPFLAVWYPLGIVIPALAGWVAGPRLLRW
ncbi:MAG: DUF1109 domain-containing protein [Betaproteobacteria bacterium]|nr:DUF1109 domain-containing protein [Betaproteobacteria bacterium]